MRHPILLLGLLASSVACASVAKAPETTGPTVAGEPSREPVPERFQLERISTKVPFPRGLALVEGQLFALCRGRTREAGGANTAVADQAGTIYVIDPRTAEPVASAQAGAAARDNGQVFALPTEPPFRLFDARVEHPTDDRVTDRPYCTLRYHAPTQSFYICAFSGIDKSEQDKSSFSKNLSDGILRYDRRTGRWYEVERHDIEKGGLYPHHDPRRQAPPHGWLNGPDNCIAVGHQLYAVSKDNSLLVRYDLSKLATDPEAGPPPSTVVVGSQIEIRGLGRREFYGHSALALHDRWLYLAFRTSSEIVRLRLGADDLPVQPLVAELVARFDPYDPSTRRSANITDMAVDQDGRLYVLSAKPSRVYRFVPNPQQVFDGRSGGPERPWVDLAAMLQRKDTKSENILLDDSGRLYITAADAYDFQSGSSGAIYRLTPLDS